MNEMWNQVYHWMLLPLIGGGLLMIATMLFRKRYKWGIFFSGVFVSVLLYELQGVLEDGKTISEQYGDWIQQDPIWAFAGLVFMAIWMIALVSHLLAAGLRRKK